MKLYFKSLGMHLKAELEYRVNFILSFLSQILVFFTFYFVILALFTKFDNIKGFVDNFNNLFLIGRNGMHRYNNMDHSMLSAMEAVNNIITGRADNENIWSVNSEKEYHESADNKGD